METDKVKAVYELREAAEEHGRVEAQIGDMRDHESRRRLLASRVELEAKTQQAIESCHFCGRSHAEGEGGHGEVIEIDFRRDGNKKNGH